METMKGGLEEELGTIIGHLKRLIGAHRDMGMDPPRLSAASLQYLEARHGLPDSLDSLKEEIGDCTRCTLSRSRNRLVFGEGDPQADLIFVGEAPGREEDAQGRPFVGEAGTLLTRIIQAMGLNRESVYICNVVKCRPPQNRDPDPDEQKTCIPFLLKQIEIIHPKVICALGRVAGKALLGNRFKISRDRGEWQRFKDVPLMPTYHPAYLLRNPSAKRQVWEDIQKVMARMGLEVRKNGS
jgi:DNA polymerase